MLQYITEKDGVIVDRRVEKRQTKRLTVEANEEDIDYDKVCDTVTHCVCANYRRDDIVTRCGVMWCGVV